MLSRLARWSWLVGFLLLWLTFTGCQQKTEVPPSTQDITYTGAGQDIQVAPWESELPTDIILVIDQSGSMSKGKHPTDPTGLRVQGSLAFLEFVAGRAHANLVHRFGVVNFGSDAPRKYAVPLTSIASLEDPSLQQIRPQLTPLGLGDTSFISALRLATQLLREGGSFAEQRNRALVLFTDGEPDDPRKLPLQRYFAELQAFIEQEVKPQQVDLFIVGIDAVGKQWSATIPSWRQLVGETQVFTTPTMSALKDQFNRIVQHIWHLPEVEPVVVSSQSPVEFAVEPYLAAVEFHLFPSSAGLSLRILRPDGKVVKPGDDPDTPPVQHLSTSDRIVVHEPEPGRWRYEVVGGAGKVEVLRNPIPLRMQLVSPSQMHPQGKPMRLIAEFKRTDGKPVKPHPDYPLGLAADVVPPSGQRIPVKFSLESGQGGIFTGEPDIEDTTTPGEYHITLKVSGGGQYQSKQPAVIQVKPVPYLIVQQPTEGVPVIPASTLDVRVQLRQGGQPLRAQDAFANHPDHLVMAQVTQTPGGKRGDAVWLDQVKEANAIGQFVKKLPLSEAAEGTYTLAVKLAPEEEAKLAVADQTVVGFMLRKAPKPLWVRVVRGLLIGVPVLTLIAWRVRRRYVARLRLPFYYWVEDQPTWRVIVLTRANDAQDLPDVPLRITRIGKEQTVRAEPATRAKLLTGDGREISSWEMQGGGRLLVQIAAGSTKAVNFAFVNPPPRPEPSERPTDSDEDSREAPTREDGVDWGFGKTVK
jgi:uncharacterized protein YegL